MINFKFDFTFDTNLREVPVNVQLWRQQVEAIAASLKNRPATSENVGLFERMGFALRVLKNWSDSQFYLEEALSVGYQLRDPARVARNLLRLAHTHQWAKQFEKASALFSQVKILIRTGSLPQEIEAFFHQHYGKFFFDQRYYRLALTHFNAAMRLRSRDGVSEDLRSSSLRAATETARRLERSAMTDLESCVFSCSLAGDEREIHDVHMISIRQLCAGDYTEAQLAAWGDRPFDPESRARTRQHHFLSVVRHENKIQGFVQARLRRGDERSIVFLDALYLTPLLRKRFVGKFLFDLVSEFAKAENVTAVELNSTLTARDFYLKRGCTIKGAPQNLTIRGVDIPNQPMEFTVR